MMDKSLQALCNTLKKVIWQLKPQQNPLSFILLTGRDHQGKSTLLRQSHYEHVSVDAECGADIYFNQHGLILELGESWLNQSKNLLQYTLKQLNHCHRSLKISGILLCVDINELLTAEPLQYLEQSKTHTQLLNRFGQALNYPIDAAIIFTKLDAIAGFCEFFQNEHATDLKKPLGFSLDWITRQHKIHSNYKAQFEQFIEFLGQQVIYKMHPARSSIKRTLIREFPLQLASLGRGIQILIETIQPQFIKLKAIYFSSGEQGGLSLDKLNQKIQHEYSLTIQDKFPQSINHRAYFIEGALLAFQNQTKRLAEPIQLPYQWTTGLLAGMVTVALIGIGVQHFKSARLLDNASKELLEFDAQEAQLKQDPSSLYHLSKASAALNKLSAHSILAPTLQQLKLQVHTQTKQHLQGDFLPTLLAEVEQTMIDAKQSQNERYQALKIYLMLGNPARFSDNDVSTWFHQKWQTLPTHIIEKKLVLLSQVIQQPLQPIAINQQIVSDVRNYLNALPPNYLYYTLAKSYFPKEQLSISGDGFILSNTDLPIYFTKAGFHQVIAKLPSIATHLEAENWVLARQDLNQLSSLLQQAYCYEYALWWQNFMRKSIPQHFQNYQQARTVTQTLHQSDIFSRLVELIQQQTSPESGDNAALFNQQIASKFTDLSLMSHTAIRDLTTNIYELQKFLNTLAIVNDQGKTAFTLAKSRFEGDTLSNPLSALYSQARQLPDPVSAWTKQIADDTWFILINDCRAYINKQWQQTVVPTYQATIAKRYPFDASQTQDVAIEDFNRFFANHGVFNHFIDQYLKPFLDTSQPQWQLKELNNYVLPISAEMINELIRANVITNMFFPQQSETSHIEFSLQKLNLDPVVSRLLLVIGNTSINDTQESESTIRFHWPESNAKLSLDSIEGKQYELEEHGPWALFKMLQKVNVLVDEQDSSNLQILFEINGNSGRYLLKAQNQVNPFIPGILSGFSLNDSIA